VRRGSLRNYSFSFSCAACALRALEQA